MITIKSEQDLEKMRQACLITKQTLELIEKHIKPGVSTAKLDSIASKFIASKGGKASFKNYNGYPASICTSLNSVVVHGIPSKTATLEEGDIISVDVGVYYKGFHGDSARTFLVGKVHPEIKRLVNVTKESFYQGIKGVKAGSFVGDISHNIQKYVEKNGFSCVRELVGHGIGKELHEEPQVPNFGRKGSGPRLASGMTLAIEPMVNMGERNVIFLDDGWTCCTRDGLPSAHYENTVLITESGVEILT